jgi:hypothetical protein
MLFCADTSAAEAMGSTRPGGLDGMACRSPLEAGAPVADTARITAGSLLTVPAVAHACVGPHSVACDYYALTVAARAVAVAEHDFWKSPHSATAVPIRIFSHVRMRVTRLQNGSILCCRDRPQAHLVAALLDPNDDTASEGDDMPDDDDSRNDLTGDDNSNAPNTAWLRAMALYLIAPRWAPAATWICPSLPPYATQRLRC